MARPQKDFPKWSPKQTTRSKFNSIDFKTRLKALRSSSSNFIKRSDVRKMILNKCSNKCSICGSEDNLTIDHIISVYRCAKGEIAIEILNTYENLSVLCNSCNSRKKP